MKRTTTFDFIAIFSLFTVLCFFFLRFVYPVQQIIITPDFGQSDAVTSLSTKFLYSTALHNRTIPFWSARIGGGYPVYANGGMGIWYVPNIILFSFFSLPVAFTASLFLSLLLLGSGMYVWIRSFGISRLSALFGAITTALSGYVIVQFTHITIIQSLGIFPWCMFLCHLLIHKPTYIYMLILAFLYSQLIFIGFAQSIFITSLTMLVYVLWFSYKNKTIGRSILYIASSTIIGVLLSAVHLLPAMEFLRQLNGNGTFGADTATLFSYPLKHLLTLLNPYAIGNPANGTYPHFFAFNGSIFWENTAYIGIIPILLCAYYAGALLLGKRFINRASLRSIVLPFFGSLAVGAFLLMLGRNSPIYLIYTFYPFTLFRVPSRFIWLFIISLILIASIVLDSILRNIRAHRTRVLIGVFLLLIQTLTIFYTFSGYHNIEPANEWLKPPSFAQYMLPGYTISIGGETAYNSAYLEHGWDRTDTNDRPSYVLRNTFTPDKNALWNISQIKDYSGREFKRTKIMIDLLSQTITTGGGYATVSATGEKLFSLYGISNVISTLKLSHKTLEQKAQLTDPKTQITLFHNVHSLPKAYIASEIVTASTVKEAVSRLISDSFIVGKSAVTDRLLSASVSGTPASLRIVSQTEGMYEYELSPSDHDSLIVTTENYYPGWRATADGKEVASIPINVSQIGIVVPKQTKHVQLQFIPTSFQNGAIISISTVLFIVIVAGFLLFV